MDDEAETEEAQMPLSQSLESVTRKIQIKTKGKVFAVVRESYLRNRSMFLWQPITYLLQGPMIFL
jgi:hypothetical protein